MARRHRLTFLLGAFLMTSAVAVAQSPEEPASREGVQIGVVVGGGWSEHRGAFDGGGECGRIENGAGLGIVAGVSLSFRPGPGGSWGVTPRVTYEERPGRTTRETPVDKILSTDQTTGEPIIIDRSDVRASAITLSFLNMEVLYGVEIYHTSRFALDIQAGPAFHYLLSSRIVQTFKGFDTTGTEVCRDGELPIGVTRYSMKGGVIAEISLIDGLLFLAPGIFYDYGFGGDDDAWNVSTLFAQAELRVRL